MSTGGLEEGERRKHTLRHAQTDAGDGRHTHAEVWGEMGQKLQRIQQQRDSLKQEEGQTDQWTKLLGVTHSHGLM